MSATMVSPTEAIECIYRLVEDYDADLVELLRPLRHALHMTSTEFAEMLHCTASLVTQREQNKRVLSGPDLVATLRLLGVRVLLVPDADAKEEIRALLRDGLPSV